MTESAATNRPVVVVGTANVDSFLFVDPLPVSGETGMGDSGTACGGKAANQAVAAARLGADVSLITRVGDDDNGRLLLHEMNKEGVDTSGVPVITGGTSGLALIFVDKNGHTMIGVAEGVNRFMQTDDLDAAPGLHDPQAIVVAELGVPLEIINRLCQLSSEVGFTFVLNPAPAVAPLAAELWQGIDVVTPNETEASVLTGIKVTDDETALQAATRLHELGAGLGIVTIGEHGVAWCSDQGSGVLPAFKVDAVDTTAASDSFNAGLVVAMRSESDHAEAIRYGQAVGALCVTKAGAQTSLPTKDEVDQFLAGGPALREKA